MLPLTTIWPYMRTAKEDRQGGTAKELYQQAHTSR